MLLVLSRAAKRGKRTRRIPRSAAIGLAVIALYLALALFAPLIAPYREMGIVARPYEAPSLRFWLGTDTLGRDMLSRIIFGARNTLGIALLTTLLSFLLGGGAGLLAATAGRWLDQALGRAADVLIALPKLIFALMILAILGTSVTTLIITIAVLDSPRVFRLSRALAVNVSAMDFVDVARLRGESAFWIVRKEVLPNLLTPLLGEFGVRFVFVFSFIAALGFLGLGLQPPTADWGSMVKENATLVSFGNVIAIVPAAAIAILALAVNTVLDWAMNLSTGLTD